jgi:hypothetical protein
LRRPGHISPAAQNEGHTNCRARYARERPRRAEIPGNHQQKVRAGGEYPSPAITLLR